MIDLQQARKIASECVFRDAKIDIASFDGFLFQVLVTSMVVDRDRHQMVPRLKENAYDQNLKDIWETDYYSPTMPMYVEPSRVPLQSYMTFNPPETRQDVVEAIFEAVKNHELHEIAESFYYQGLRVFDPHGPNAKS